MAAGGKNKNEDIGEKMKGGNKNGGKVHKKRGKRPFWL